MKIKGLSYLDSGDYQKIMIMNARLGEYCVVAGEKKTEDTISFDNKFSTSILGLNDEDKKEKIIRKFINENSLNYLILGFSLLYPRYEYSIGTTNNKELLVESSSSKKLKSEILNKYISDRYEFLLKNIDTSDTVTLRTGSVSRYIKPLDFILACNYYDIFQAEKELISYLMELLYNDKEITIIEHTTVESNKKSITGYEINGLKKRIVVDNMFDEHYYLDRGCNFILNEINEIAKYLNKKNNEAKKLQLKMEEFK